MPLVPEEILFNEMGTQRTRALFKETCVDGDTPFFTIGHREREGLVNLRKLFIELTEDDPTEMTFAEEVFGDFKYWTKITQSNLLTSHIEEWRIIADTKRKQKAFKAIIKEAKSGKSAFSAAKYLIEEPWTDRKQAQVRERIKKTTSAAAKNVQEDIDRLREEGFLN